MANASSDQSGRHARARVPMAVPGDASRWDVAGGRTGLSGSAATRVGTVLRVVFGIVWALDAALKWLPSFVDGFGDAVHQGAERQPGWLQPWFRFVQFTLGAHAVIASRGVAVAESALAIALILGIARKTTYIAGAVWSLLIWATAEGFGHPQSGMSRTDPGAAILYAFIFLGLLALDWRSGRVQEGTRPFSVDAAVERAVPGWRDVAETRR